MRIKTISALLCGLALTSPIYAAPSFVNGLALPGSMLDQARLARLQVLEGVACVVDARGAQNSVEANVGCELRMDRLLQRPA